MPVSVNPDPQGLHDLPSTTPDHGLLLELRSLQVADFLMGLEYLSRSWNSVNESAAGISRFFWQRNNLIFKVLGLSNSTACGPMSTTSLGNYEV